MLCKTVSWVGLAAVATVLATVAHTMPPTKRAESNAVLVARALADPGRAMHRAEDARRHPAELVGLSDVREGQRILDLIPGDGYWTRIFSKIVGPLGRVYAVWPAAYAKLAKSNVETLKAMSASAAYANITTLVQESTDLSAPEPLDLIWTSQNYHDYDDPFMGKPSSASLARAAFRLLKPNGTFVVIDHASVAGRGVADTDTLHRIDPDLVIREARAAGFILVGSSAVLTNPRDTRTIPVFDKAIRGHTSQFALKFRKPAR